MVPLTLAHDGDDVEYADGEVPPSSHIVRHFVAVPSLGPRSLSATIRRTLLSTTETTLTGTRQ